MTVQVSPDTTVTITIDWGKSINLDELSAKQLTALADTIRFFEHNPLDRSAMPDELFNLVMRRPPSDRCRELEGALMSGLSTDMMDVFMQYELSKIAYRIEHPNQTNDKLGAYISGVEGAINIYEGLASEGVEDAGMDNLLKLKSSGDLNSFVEDRIKDCK